MSAFHSRFLRQDRFQAFIGNRIHLGFFGKHHGYGDFLVLAIESESLRMLEALVFREGVRRQLVAWEGNANLIPFDHWLVWQRGAQAIVGRLWRSADSHGREEFPLGFCVHTVSVGVPWLCANLLPQFEKVKAESLKPGSLEQLRSGYSRIESDLRRRIKAAPTNEGPPPVSLDRASFAARPEFGPASEKLIRIIVSLASGSPSNLDDLKHAFRQLILYMRSHLTRFAPNADGAQHLRLPACGTSAAQVFTQWSDFLNYLIGWQTPKLLVFPDGRDWLDILIGEPVASQFGFLRFPPMELPSSFDEAQPVEPDLNKAAAGILKDFVSHASASLTTTQKVIRLGGLILVPLLAGTALAGYLKFSQPDNIPKLLHDLAHRLGNPYIKVQ